LSRWHSSSRRYGRWSGVDGSGSIEGGGGSERNRTTVDQRMRNEERPHLGERIDDFGFAAENARQQRSLTFVASSDARPHVPCSSELDQHDLCATSAVRVHLATDGVCGAVELLLVFGVGNGGSGATAIEGHPLRNDIHHCWMARSRFGQREWRAFSTTVQRSWVILHHIQTPSTDVLQHATTERVNESNDILDCGCA
jgi:hypothetical protein